MDGGPHEDKVAQSALSLARHFSDNEDLYSFFLLMIFLSSCLIPISLLHDALGLNVLKLSADSVITYYCALSLGCLIFLDITALFEIPSLVYYSKKRERYFRNKKASSYCYRNAVYHLARISKPIPNVFNSSSGIIVRSDLFKPFSSIEKGVVELKIDRVNFFKYEKKIQATLGELEEL